MDHLRLNIGHLFVLASITLLAVTTSAVAESCTEAQAYNKMMALGRAQARLMASGEKTVQATGSALTMDTAMVGQLLAEKKYTEACGKYDEIAKKHGIDLTKESQGLVTYEELAKDGGKRGGTCSQAEAHVKMMGLHQQLEDKVALGDATGDVFSQFNDDTAKLGELMYTSPSEMCRKLDGLKEKYKLQ